MAPVRSYTNWNSRTTDEEEQIEPYRKYFFICEGANTETWYFKKLIDIRKELNIHPLIDIRLLEKTEGDRDISFPRRLIEFAENQKENSEIAFDKERDKMIVVFDGDIFEEKVLDYDELVAEGEKNNILAVSNPAFELFLLLHYENSYEDDIEPNAEQIIQNEKDGHQTFIYKLLLARTGINPKKNSAIGELAKNIEIAIEQEKKINEDIHQCKGQITCNIGRIIDDIRNDDEITIAQYYTYEQMFDYLKLNSKQLLAMNGEKVAADAVFYDGAELEIQLKETVETPAEQSAAEPEKEEIPSKTETVQVFKDMVEQAAKEEKSEEKPEEKQGEIVVIANQKPIVLKGKDSYQFVDIFDYIDFDTRTMKGKGIVTLVNGENAQYTQELKNGDKVEIFWK